MSQTTPMTLKLESETCSRCGGTGNYSYCQMYGTRCFKCAGRKEVLTKRGAAAANFLREIRSRLINDLKPGDWIQVGCVTMGGTPYNEWAKVIEVRLSNLETESCWIDKETGERRSYILVKTENKKGETHATYTFADRKFVLWGTKEERQEWIDRTMAYQATLTKQGKPRKR